MKHYEVAPLTYIGRDKDVLTYRSSEDIAGGMYVIVPIRGKKVAGIVLRSVVKPSFESKDILEILFDKPVISEPMLEVARWISTYYAASLPSVLGTFLPGGITTKRRKVTSYPAMTKSLDKHKKLTLDQTKVFTEIEKNLGKKPQLLFGVTGSGKTEIYLQLIAKEIEKGKGAIVLVPEVSLTPQALDRYSARFPGRVVVMHSYLKETERFAAWKAVFDGEVDIVIGSRSALFAPMRDLGLIIIDEAHETSYKQDQSPRYEATKVAEKIAELTNCGLVFGTATPSIEMFSRAKSGQFDLKTLSNRIVQDKMPEIEIVDMRHEFQYGNKSIFSEKLQYEIKATLSVGGQILLFINRRGMSTFVSCRDCGYVAKCPNCDIPLTFHYNDLKLTCHHCGHSEQPAVVCPKCNSMAIRYFGSGTQKVEQEIKKLFGDVRVSRMDKDTTKTTGSHEKIYNEFAANDVDILIGTQMITKGWDLPNVRLVGVVSADAMLNYPDYRANERAYQLITQIAGRTGRGEHAGKVVLQTYAPDNPIFKAIQVHDFTKFYQTEIGVREELRYPPFAKLVKMLYNNESLDEAKVEAQRVAQLLENEEIIGPSPAFIPKLSGKYRYQIVVKAKQDDYANFTGLVARIVDITNNNWSIDIDPVSLL